MNKLCPFKKKTIKRIVTTDNDSKKPTILEECEQEFLECIKEQCAAWTSNGCGRICSAIKPEQEENRENKTDELIEAHVTVLEAKETKTPGTIRAWCQHIESNKKEAFFAKNGVGKILAESIEKQVQVKYRRMNNGTAFVVFAEGRI